MKIHRIAAEMEKRTSQLFKTESTVLNRGFVILYNEKDH